MSVGGGDRGTEIEHAGLYPVHRCPSDRRVREGGRNRAVNRVEKKLERHLSSFREDRAPLGVDL